MPVKIPYKKGVRWSHRDTKKYRETSISYVMKKALYDYIFYGDPDDHMRKLGKKIVKVENVANRSTNCVYGFEMRMVGLPTIVIDVHMWVR